MHTPPEPPLRWALLADDLSGAADSAVAFAAAGFRTRLELNEGGASDAELTAFSTETRESSPDAAAVAVAKECERLQRLGFELKFKKIDSVLRGPVQAEIAATLVATGLETAVVCPAFPSQGRQVRGGHLFVHGEDRGAVPYGESFEVRDAVTDADLEALAAELLRRPTVLPVGSGGLAAAYAPALGKLHRRAAKAVGLPRSNRPAVFWIGSLHPAATVQMDRLEASGLPYRLVRVDMDRAQTDVSELVASIQRGELGALVLSGGATARRVLENLGAKAIEIRGESIPGAPWGTIVAGVADGSTVITKSGGFGDPDAFVRIVGLLRS